MIIFETESQNVAQADLELSILLPQPPECYDYRCITLCPVLKVFLKLLGEWSRKTMRRVRNTDLTSRS
jgi:hypothetical protein